MSTGAGNWWAASLAKLGAAVLPSVRRSLSAAPSQTAAAASGAQPLAADLAAALDADPAARAAWDAFPPSSRKQGIAQVDTARRAETRAARIAKVVAGAAEGRRP